MKKLTVIMTVILFSLTLLGSGSAEGDPYWPPPVLDRLWCRDISVRWDGIYSWFQVQDSTAKVIFKDPAAEYPYTLFVPLTGMRDGTAYYILGFGSGIQPYDGNYILEGGYIFNDQGQWAFLGNVGDNFVIDCTWEAYFPFVLR